MANPGIENYDLTTYNGVKNKNLYKIDNALKRIVDRHCETLNSQHSFDLKKHLEGYGELVGGILNELTDLSHKEGKYGELVKYDSVGNRIDEIVYSKEQLESRKISFEYGVVNLDFHENWKHSFTDVHRYALTYLMNLNGEGGVACPLAMTDGLILALKKIGNEEQKRKYLPLIAGEKSKSYFFAGQYVTERVGGSNVGANRTIARKRSDGKWILNGEKWFCSNPGDLWVTTARIEGSSLIGLFLVPRFKDNGDLNGHHLLRKKDIIGSRGKVTAEAIYEDLEAEELGRPIHGLVNLLKYVIKISRIHVGLGACGNARRAVLEAFEYANYRTAYGKGLLKFPIFARNLAVMNVLQTVMTFANFQSIEFWGKNIDISDVVIPLLKYKSSSQATWICRNAILCLGGNGIVGDFSPLPRYLNDSIINESWEGTHFLLTDHVLHALGKPKQKKSFMEFVESALLKIQKLNPTSKLAINYQSLVHNFTNEIQKDKQYKDLNRVQIADLAYSCFAVATMIEEVEFDFNHGVVDSIYLLISSVFTDLQIYGVDGIMPDNFELNDEINRNRILSY
jgi:alkylation response protein AidB-like acyl-CoA dehydrogenase